MRCEAIPGLARGREEVDASFSTDILVPSASPFFLGWRRTRQLDDAGDTREERQFRLWINSLGLEQVYVNHLFADLSDGVVLLKVSKASIDTRRAWPWPLGVRRMTKCGTA